MVFDSAGRGGKMRRKMRMKIRDRGENFWRSKNEGRLAGVGPAGENMHCAECTECGVHGVRSKGSH